MKSGVCFGLCIMFCVLALLEELDGSQGVYVQADQLAALNGAWVLDTCGSGLWGMRAAPRVGIAMDPVRGSHRRSGRLCA